MEKKVIKIFFTFLLFFGFASIGISQVLKSDKEFQFAKKLYDDNLMVLAAEQFQQFVIDYPNTDYADNAQFLSGKAYFEAAEYKKAFNAFKRLELDYPQSKFLAEGRYRLAGCQLKLEDYDAAAELFKRVAFFHPQSELAQEALIQSGHAFQKTGKHKEAKDAYYQLITRYPDSSLRIDAHLAVVDLHYKNDELKEALNQIDGIFKVFGSDANDPRVYWLRAEVFKNLAQYEEAEKNYIQLTTKYPQHELAGKACYELAVIAYNKADYAESLKQLAKVPETLPDPAKADVYLKKAETLIRLNNFADAKTVLQQASSLKSNSTRDINYKLAFVYTELGNHEKAETILSTLLNNEGIKELDSYFHYFQLYISVLEQQSKYEKAVTAIVANQNNFTKSWQQSEILFKKAGLLQKRKDYSAALREYDFFIEKFPLVEKVDDAQLELANCYLRLEDYRMALRELEKYGQKFPAGDHWENVQAQISRIKQTVPLDAGKGLSDVADLIRQSMSDSIDWSLKLGELYLKNKDFTAAVTHLKNTKIYTGKYLLGKAYLGLKSFNELIGESELANSYLDSANAVFTTIAKDSSGNREEIAFLMLESGKTPDVDVLKSWKENFPGGQYTLTIQYNLANYYLQNIEDSTGVLNALEIFKSISNANNEFSENAVFGMLKCFTALKQDSMVVTSGKEFLRDYPRSNYAVEALWLMANAAFNINDLTQAKDYFGKIIEDYFYSNRTEKAKNRVADIYIKNKEYRSALDYYNSLYAQGAIAPAYNKAFAYENLGMINEALVEYIQYISNNPESPQKNMALFAVGRLATQTKNLTLAQEYYRSLLNSAGSASAKYKANFAVADILFNKKLYGEAKQYYISALQFAETDSAGKAAYANSIRCQYKLKAFAIADKEVKKFKKRYKDTKEFEAQFLLDKGDALVADKNFPDAEDVYKDLRGDFKKTDWGAYGEFGLGAVYLITNHTEDALKILTEIPEKYPASKVTPLAYYNLGDFYMKNQQVQSAIHAFNKVRQHEKAGDLKEKALLYLIQSYHDARQFDQAIVVTREFLAQYPESEHAFRKKIDMAQFLMNLKEYDRAIEEFRKLLPFADKETEAEIQFYIGQCYKDIGNYSQAAVEYLKVKYLTQPTKLPWHVTALFESGRCLVRIKQFTQAIKIFNQIVREQGAESSFGRFALSQLQEIEGNSSLTTGNSN